MNMNSNSKITFSEEQHKYLEKLFPSITIDENTSLNKIMINTGERRVLDLVKSNIGFTMRRNIRDQ